MTPGNGDTVIQSLSIKIANSEKKFPDFFNITKHTVVILLPKDFMFANDIFLKFVKRMRRYLATFNCFENIMDASFEIVQLLPTR